MAKYIELLNEGKEEKEKKANSLAAANAKSSVEQYVSQKNAKATTLDAARASALASTAFSVDKIVALDKEIADNNTELETGKKLLTELF